MIQEYEKGQNPNKTIILLKAIQQSRITQEQAVIKETIERYQIKSILIEKLREVKAITEDNQAAEQAKL